MATPIRIGYSYCYHRSVAAVMASLPMLMTAKVSAPEKEGAMISADAWRLVNAAAGKKKRRRQTGAYLIIDDDEAPRRQRLTARRACVERAGHDWREATL